jgi:hypothetical protein
MKKIITVLLVILTAAGAAAQDHSHNAKHKGIVQEAGGYHIEMVKGDGELVFYLLDAEEKPSLKNDSGNVEFEFANKSKSKAALVKSSTGYFTVAYPKSPIFEFCTVTLSINGKAVSARFKNPGFDRAKQHGHEH